jgi:hypothetical protein
MMRHARAIDHAKRQREPSSRTRLGYIDLGVALLGSLSSAFAIAVQSL